MGIEPSRRGRPATLGRHHPPPHTHTETPAPWNLQEVEPPCLGKRIGLGYRQAKSEVTSGPWGTLESPRGHTTWKATYKVTIWSLLHTETSHKWTPGTWVAWLCGPCTQRPHMWAPYTGPGTTGISGILTGFNKAVRSVRSVRMFQSLCHSDLGPFMIPSPPFPHLCLPVSCPACLSWDCVPRKAEINQCWEGTVPQ